MRSMLYYPLINPPVRVLVDGVLYWDKIASIVPPEREDLISADVRVVRQAGLYRALNGNDLPSDLVGGSLAFLCSSLKRLPRSASHRDGSRYPLSLFYWHKLPSEFQDELKRRGFMQKVNREHFYLRSDVGDCALAVLAPIVAKYENMVKRPIWSTDGTLHGYRQDSLLYPYTDDASLWKYSQQSSVNRMPATPDFRGTRTPDPTNACWLVDLGDLLPIPSPNVSIRDVIDFRMRYNDERRRLVDSVQNLINELQLKYESPHDVFRLCRSELADALDDLIAAGRSRRIGWTKRSLAVSVALGAGATATQLPSNMSWLLGAVGGAAINIATTQTRASTYHFPHIDLSYLARLPADNKGSKISTLSKFWPFANRRA